MKFAERMTRLGTETAFEVLAKAKALERDGKSIIHLEIGEPDFDTPRNIVEAGKKALDEGWTHYGPANGLPEFREVIAEYISDTRNIPVHPDEVVVMPGGKPVIFFAIMACIENGDEVIYPNPGFPIYESMIDFVFGKSVPLPLQEKHGFGFSIEDLKSRITSKTRMLILNSPSNPTGGILPKSDIEEIAKICRENDIVLLSDEIYSRILYEGEHFSPASISGMKDLTIILDGFSKTYAMTGWRLGYGVMPRELAKLVTQLAINDHSCTASFVQRAGIEALQGPQDAVKEMVAQFEKRRNVIVDGLNSIDGFKCLMPKGAFYAFANVQETGIEGRKLQDYFLEKAGVACLSGTAFGEHGGGFLRFSYANSVQNIEKAIDLMKKALKEF